MMTPNPKEGIEYFPFDVNFLFELSSRRLMKKYGPELVYAYINQAGQKMYETAYYPSGTSMWDIGMPRKFPNNPPGYSRYL